LDVSDIADFVGYSVDTVEMWLGLRPYDGKIKEESVDKGASWAMTCMTYKIRMRDAELRGEERGAVKGEKKAKGIARKCYASGIKDVDSIATLVGYPVLSVNEWLGLSLEQ